tara:strand:- start:1185 stop:1499 length:315 start_codon:yes stop_codon:yes gene_type:complete
LKGYGVTTKFIQDDTGKIIDVNVGIDITNAAALKLLVKKPDATEVEWVASEQQADPGVLRYTTVAGDLDQEGAYYLHGFVETAGGALHTGRRASFMVVERYEGP